MDCACDKCRAMCENSACLPTPEGARALIRAGYGDRLARYEFPGIGNAVGPALKGKEGHLLHNTMGGACTFYSGGKCEVHAIKPLEGRLAHHDKHWLPIRQHVMTFWGGKRYESVTKALHGKSL